MSRFEDNPENIDSLPQQQEPPQQLKEMTVIETPTRPPLNFDDWEAQYRDDDPSR